MQAPTFDLMCIVGIKALLFKRRVTIEQVEHTSIETEIKLETNKADRLLVAYEMSGFLWAFSLHLSLRGKVLYVPR